MVRRAHHDNVVNFLVTLSSTKGGEVCVEEELTNCSVLLQRQKYLSRQARYRLQRCEQVKIMHWHLISLCHFERSREARLHGNKKVLDSARTDMMEWRASPRNRKISPVRRSVDPTPNTSW